MARLPSNRDLGRLPTYRDLGGMPSGQSGRMIANYDTSAVGKGMASLGASIMDAAGSVASIGASLARASEKVGNRDKFKAKTDFLEFEEAQRRRLAEVMASTPPGVSGFEGAVREQYSQDAKKFLGSVPEPLKPQYDFELFRLETRIGATAAKFEANGRNVHARQKIDAGSTVLLGRLRDSPESWEEVDADAEDLIRTSDIDPAEQELKLEEWRGRRAAEQERTWMEYGMSRASTDPEGFLDEVETREFPEEIRGTFMRLASDAVEAHRERETRNEWMGDDGVLREYVKHMASGAIERPWVVANSDMLPPRAVALAERGLPARDADNHADLVAKTLKNPANAMEAAIEPTLDGTLSAATLGLVNTISEDEATPEGKARNRLRAHIMATVADPDARVEALEAFEAAVGDEKTDPFEAAQKIVTDSNRRYVRELRQELPLPKFAKRDLVNLDALQDAADETVRRLNAGMITDAEAAREAAVMRKWARIMEISID